MAYATVQQFVESVSEAEAVALARAAPPETGCDAGRIGQALDDASDELDTYFASRYPTPLAPAPATATQAAIALAREALDRQGRDQVKAAAARWRAWARDVAKGVAVLGGGVVGEDVPAQTTSSGVQHAGPSRIFDDAGLSSYLGRSQ